MSRRAWWLAVVCGTAWLFARYSVALAHSPKRAFVLTGHHGPINCLAFSPDGRILVSGSDDNTVWIWNPLTGRPVHTLNLRAPVTSVAFSPDGRTLAIGRAAWLRLDTKPGGVDTTVERWDTTGWRRLRPLPQHWMGVPSLAFSPNGNLLATANRDGTVRVWNLSSNVAAQTVKVTHPHAVAFTPEGTRLVVGTRNGVGVLNLQTKQETDGARLSDNEVFDLKGFAPRLHAVAVSPDGKMLATGGSDRITGLWDMGTGKRLPLLSGRADGVVSVAFSRDGRTLARGSWTGGVSLWSMRTGQRLSAFQAIGRWWSAYWGDDDTYVRAMAFSPGGELLATGGDDHVVTLWTVRGR